MRITPPSTLCSSTQQQPKEDPDSSHPMYSSESAEGMKAIQSSSPPFVERSRYSLGASSNLQTLIVLSFIRKFLTGPLQTTPGLRPFVSDWVVRRKHPIEGYGEHPAEPLGPSPRRLFDHAKALMVDLQVCVPLVPYLHDSRVSASQTANQASRANAASASLGASLF